MEADDFSVIISSTKTLCEIVNNFLSRISEIHRDDDQLSIKCDILR
jgi:diacylglycerol kinase (ATP)